MNDIRMMTGLIYGVILSIWAMFMISLLFFGDNVAMVAGPFCLLVIYNILIAGRYLRREKEFQELVRGRQ